MYKAVWYDPAQPTYSGAKKPTACWLLNALSKDGYNGEAIIVLDVPGTELPLRTVRLGEIRVLRRVVGVLEEG